MELFGKIGFNDPLNYDLLLNKNDFIKFLKKDKTFERAEHSNHYHEERRVKDILNYYYDYREDLKIKKYIKKLKNKIEEKLFQPKIYLEKLEKVKENIHDLQLFEKKLFNQENVSTIESDDSELLRRAEKDNNLKRKKILKFQGKTIYDDKKGKYNPLIEPKKIIEFMKENKGLIKRYLNFTKFRKAKTKELKSWNSNGKQSKKSHINHKTLIDEEPKKKDPKYENFYKKRLKTQNTTNRKIDLSASKLDNEKNRSISQSDIEDENKYDSNCYHNKENKDANHILSSNVKKNYSRCKTDKFFITNINDNFNTNTLYLDSKKPSNHPSNKALKRFGSNKNVNNSSILNESNSKLNLKNNFNYNSENINSSFKLKYNDVKSNANLQFSRKQTINNKLADNQINNSIKTNNIKNNYFSPGKENSSKSIKNFFNSSNKNNNNLEQQNTSFCSNTSFSGNKSIAHFISGNPNSTNPMANQLTSTLRENHHKYPTRIFSANNLNNGKQFFKAFDSPNKPFRNTIHSNSFKGSHNQFLGEINPYIATINANQILKSQSQNPKRKKITNQEREWMYKIKSLNEEIANMKPTNDETIEKMPKTDLFNRYEMRKIKNKHRSTRFYYDPVYQSIKSNFKQKKLNDFNEFYSHKFDINNKNAAINEYLTHNHFPDQKNFITNNNLSNNLLDDNEKNNNFTNVSKALDFPTKNGFKTTNKNFVANKTQNPTLIDFTQRKRNEILYDLNKARKSKSNNKCQIESKRLIKKQKIFDEIAHVDENFKQRQNELNNLPNNLKISRPTETKQIIIKASKDVDIQDLKYMVIGSINEFKSSRGFLTEDFDTNKALNKINKVKYDLYNYRNKKK